MKRPPGTHPIYWHTLHVDPPSEWMIRPFAEYAEATKGKLPKSLLEKPTEKSKPYLLIDGLTSEASLYTEDDDIPMVNAEDTVVVADGSRSGLVIRGVAGALGSTLLRYHTKDDFDHNFVFYVLESLYPYLNTATIGGAIPHLDKHLLAQLSLAIPALPEQQYIGNMLFVVDKTILEGNHELQAAQRLKTALMQHLFTGGIPGRHDQFVKIDRGCMPANWELPLLKDVADVHSGVTLNQDRAPRRHAFRYLTVINVQRDRIVLDAERYLELWESEVPEKLLQEQDILVVEGHANSQEIGRAAIVADNAKGLTYQNHLFRIRLKVDELLPEFLLFTLNSERVQRHWNAICNTSSGLNTINRRQLRNLAIPKPDIHEQNAIVDLITNAKASIRAIEGKLTALKYLKQSLLQNLLTGTVRIPMEVIP